MGFDVPIGKTGRRDNRSVSRIGQDAACGAVARKDQRRERGQSSGCSLVCFNNEAENSYGKEQSYNSSVSVEAMRRYTEALNYLIRDGKHNRFVAGMTIVHFAMTKTRILISITLIAI